MKISTIAAFVDQPVIISKLHKVMPGMLIGGAAAFGLWDTRYKNKTEKFKSAVIIASTVGATLLGTRFLKIKGRRLLECEPLKDILESQTKTINEFLYANPVSEKVANILNTAKEKELLPRQIDTLIEELPAGAAKKKLFAAILPRPEVLGSEDIFDKILNLSILGAVPVAGGIAGGVLADRLTHTGSKRETANKFKEGLYQYFANICLCNVGAGAGLFVAENLARRGKIAPLTPVGKLGVTIGGIITAGVLGGSLIANFIGKNFINPLFFGRKTGHRPDRIREGQWNVRSDMDIYSEREPEMLDVALHTDDVASAGVLSGFRWIEPFLPFVYFISGYRAGTGYRSSKKD